MPKLRNVLAVVCGTVTLGGAAAWMTVRPWWHSWGVDPADAERALPGDDVIPGAPISDTRSLRVAAPPSAVWPWLLQMGYGRGGWYSYDAIDMRGSSAAGILPDHQALAVGDIVPTHPTGGFEVRAIEPEHALVLYMDAAMARAQALAAAAKSGGDAEETPANLKAAGAFMANSQPEEFKASWTFVLEPDGEDATRLIERVRADFSGSEKPWSEFLRPLMGFGVFVMVRKQMLGIRRRVEGAAAA